MKKQIWSVLAAFCLSLTLMPSWALAEETESAEMPESAEETEMYGEIDEDDFYDHEELFSAYATDVLGISPDAGVAPMAEGFAGSAESQLDSNEKAVYQVLHPMIQAVAAGNRSSTRFELGGTYPAAGNASSMSKVVHALMVDYPASLYWWGKSYTYSTRAVGFSVAEPYRAGDAYTFNTAKAARVTSALNTARGIVSGAAGKNDYEKLRTYMAEISGLVKYDYDSYYDSMNVSGYSNIYPDPWTLVSVFDGDPNTNAVCEGYSKAFQYLCDRTSWQGDVECYTVSGYMDGGGHMWNIVRIGNASYLADITNCDYTYDWIHGSGTDFTSRVPYTDRLFLVGGTPTGTNAYAVRQAKWPIPGTSSYFTEQTTTYAYDSNTLAVYPSSILSLSSSNYTYTAPKVLKGTVTITGDPTVGGTLTADVSSLMTQNSERPSGLRYEWTVGGVLSGIASSYTVKSADVGKSITVKVSAENYDTSVTAAAVTAAEAPSDGALHGTVTASMTYVASGEIVTLHVTPDANYRLSTLEVVTENGEQVNVSGSGNVYTFVMPAADVFVNAKFTKI